MEYLDHIVKSLGELYDISDEAVDRLLDAAYEKIPRDLEPLLRIPNGFVVSWKKLTMRERAFIIGTALHKR